MYETIFQRVRFYHFIISDNSFSDSACNGGIRWYVIIEEVKADE